MPHESVLSHSLDLARYLERVGLGRPRAATADALAELHAAHLRAIPFETLDIPLGRRIRLDPDHLARKMIDRRRGGFCFEQNTLFAAALDGLGFIVEPLLARVCWRAGGQVRPQTHQVLRVEIDGRDWLADVGFGGPGLRRPIPLAANTAHDQGNEHYRLRADPVFGHVLERLEAEGDWTALYSFDGARAWPADFEMGCHFAATHRDSPFVRNLVVARLSEDGRASLVDRSLRIDAGGRMIESVDLERDEDLRSALGRHFGLALSAEEIRRVADWMVQRTAQP